MRQIKTRNDYGMEKPNVEFDDEEKVLRTALRRGFIEEDHEVELIEINELNDVRPVYFSFSNKYIYINNSLSDNDELDYKAMKRIHNFRIEITELRFLIYSNDELAVDLKMSAISHCIVNYDSMEYILLLSDGSTIIINVESI